MKNVSIVFFIIVVLVSSTVGPLSFLESTPPALAQPASPGWTKIGFSGTRINWLVTHPTDPSVLFVSTDIGLYRISDAGGTPIPILAASTATMRTSLAINPNNPQEMYVANSYRGTSITGPQGDLSKSTDGGATWTTIKITGSRSITCVAIDPNNTDTIYAVEYSTGGWWWSSHVYMSPDGGATWVTKDNGLVGYNAVYPNKVVIDPVDSQTLYAVSGTNKGIWKTTNGGDSWSLLDNGLPLTTKELAVNPDNNQILYAVAGNQVYKSTNGGENWIKSSSGLSASWVVDFLALDPSTPDSLYINAREFLPTGQVSRGVFTSTDGASTWTALNDGFPPSIDSLFMGPFAISPVGPQNLYAGSNDGVWKYYFAFPPVAVFSADITSGYAPLTVNFTDQSAGTITSYHWEFGDGITSSLQNPPHTYFQAGIFTVKLTVVGPAGTDTAIEVIRVESCEAPSGLDICALEPGDILLMTPVDTDRIVLAGFVGTFWWHAGIYDEDPDGSGFVLEATGHAPGVWPVENEVMRTPIEETGFFKYAHDWIVLRLRQDQPDQQMVIQHALEWARQKAEGTNALYFQNMPISFFNPLNKLNTERFYCSLFVWRAYYEAGIDLDYPSGYLYQLVFSGPLIQPYDLSYADLLRAQVLPDDLYASAVGIPLIMPPKTEVVQRANDKGLLFVLLSPADFWITDSQGNSTGTEPITKTVTNQIPGAYYSGPDWEPEWISITGYDDDIRVEVHGTGTGSYAFAVQSFDPNTIRSQVFEWQTKPGQIDVFDVVDPASENLQIQPVQLTTAVDIKPLNEPNTLNCSNENEVITVAVHTTEYFDALSLDHTTVRFEGAAETHVDKKTGIPRRHEEDVDGDGDLDLILHFRQGDTTLTCASTEATLTGQTFDGVFITGTDAVRMFFPGAQTNGCFEEAHNAWQWKGGQWLPYSQAGASAGMVMSYSSSEPGQNTSAEFSFAAEGFALLYHKGPYGGIAAVYIDGELVSSLNMYSSEDKWMGEALFEIHGLDPAQKHELRIVPTGTKHPLSLGYMIAIDRLDLPGYYSSCPQ